MNKMKTINKMDDINVSPTESRTSSNSELEKEIMEIDINKKPKRQTAFSTPIRKARRVRFLRNGDKFYMGVVIPVSSDRYRSFDSLAVDLTKILEDNVTLPGAVRNIYTLLGRKIMSLDDLEDGGCYVCSCNSETFKKVEYTAKMNNSINNSKNSNRVSRIIRPCSPFKNGSPQTPNGRSPSEAANIVRPRIVTLIRNGIKPRKVFRLLLSKRNCPTFEHVLQALTQRVQLDSGCVRKVYTFSTGVLVSKLAGFFNKEEVFLCCGTEKVTEHDFELEPDEAKSVEGTRKPTRVSRSGPTPKMPVKSHNETYVCQELANKGAGENANETGLLPASLAACYTVGKVIGDGNFAVVRTCTDRSTGQEFALKIIDKAMCRGKEHYIDAEIRVMRLLNHPNTVGLLAIQDTPERMFLVLEMVRGGDLFDAIARATRFSELQTRTMLRHLGSAMAYIHSLGIVHRDIKPENLLVEMKGEDICVLKLGDFGLACEVTGPLYTVCGTPTYVAPEILMETGYGMKIDVWAAGVILYILLCGFPPFVSPDNDQEQLFDAILSGQFDFPEPYWNGISESVRDLILNMLQSDPDVRFNSEDMLDHSWLSQDL